MLFSGIGTSDDFEKSSLECLGSEEGRRAVGALEDDCKRKIAKVRRETDQEWALGSRREGVRFNM